MPLLTLLLPMLSTILGRVLPDPAAQAQAQLQLMQMLQTGELAQLTAQSGNIQAEVKSGNWLAAAWRPILMLVFTAIVANNYILAPYLQAMFHVGLTLELPDQMWELLKIGVGGYVVGRSVEKAVDSHAQGKIGAAQAIAQAAQPSAPATGVGVQFPIQGGN